MADQADVAQLVEQPIRNRQVIGSSPIVGSMPTLFKRRIYRVGDCTRGAALVCRGCPEGLSFEQPFPLGTSASRRWLTSADVF